MTMMLTHVATQLVGTPAARAFAYLHDPINVGRWSLGCFGTEASDLPGVYTGRSLYDGVRGWFRIDADRTRFIIDYLVGEPRNLVRRISGRVIPGSDLGYGAATCLITLTAWRPHNMSDERWTRLCAAHEAEIFLIKSQIEADALVTAPQPGSRESGVPGPFEIPAETHEIEASGSSPTDLHGRTNSR